MSPNTFEALSMAEAALPPDLIPLAHKLLSASQVAPPSELKRLLDQGAPAWFQDEDLGWSCLHYAAERREPECLRVLLAGGAVWNAVDRWGRTAGEICLSLGDREGWETIRNEGVRSDNSSAGDNLAFLQSKLTWEVGDDGRERVIDADGNGVMMGWEEPLMKEHVRLMTSSHPDAQPGGAGISVLNVGYGLGIIDRLFQSTEPRPLHHTIIEAHPQVLEHMRAQGVHEWPGVRILEGRWQDWLLDPEKVGEVLAGTPEGSGFGAVFIDTFAEGYDDLKAFFDVLPDILDGEDASFSFWNGLGATNATIYAVSSHLAELHMEDVGMGVEWHDVPIAESLRSEVWKGVRRRYWDLPGYRLPVARLQLH
ncbi:methyltransferase [Saitozyma sp. JCM 24511]|nr:methyltransferase [Saitozyma sp. JCM 24511]